MTHRPKRNKPHKPRPLVIPQMIQGFDVIDSLRTAVAGIRAIYDGTAATISRQHFTDLNMVWQQTTKVHEMTQRREPPRREILAAHNIMTRLNNDADVTRAEFEQVVDVLQRVLAAVRTDTPAEVWQDVENTMRCKEHLHGHNGDGWMGGVLRKGHAHA